MKCPQCEFENRPQAKFCMRPLVAHCHVGLGQLHRRTGDFARAQKHLANGVAMMRKMEMELWLERAE